MPGAESLAFDQVSVRRDERVILDRIDWRVEADERWVVMGRNGSGKTTIIRLASLYLHPSSGTLRVLGQTLGRTDVRQLRTRIGLSSASLVGQLRPQLTPVEIVMTAVHAALEPWWHTYTEAERTRARILLEGLDCGPLADQPFGHLSSGERQRVLLARTLMTSPDLLLLDEPAAGLDLGGREELLISLDDLAADPLTPAMVLVTHHVEEIPEQFTHALLLASGELVDAGPIDEVLTDAALSDCFGLALALEFRAGRWSARAATR